MQKKQEAEKSAFKRVRTIKDVALGIQALVVLALVGLFTSSAYTVDPLYIPLEESLFVLLIGALAVSVELIIFRALEIKHAPSDGQRYLSVAAGLRSAKRAAGVGIVVAIFFALPLTQALLVNVLSPSETRTLEIGESYTFNFSSEDALGLTKATSLRVTALTGALRIRLSIDSQPPTSGADLTAGEQYTSSIGSPNIVPYVLTFENLDTDRTRFSYRVDMGVSPPLVTLLTITSLVTAGTNLGWLIYLRRRREDLPEPKPVQRAPPLPMAAPARRPVQPVYRTRGYWTPNPMPWGAQAPPPGWGVPRQGTARQPPPNAPAPTPPPPPEEHTEAVQEEREEEPSVEEREPSLLKEVSLDIPAALAEASGMAQAGKLPEAMEIIETVLQIDRENQEALLAKADLLQRMGDLEDALRLLEETLHLDPWSEEVLLLKGQLLEDAGRDEEALGCYEAVLHGGPRHLEALIRKGDLFTGQGKHELAKEVYEGALRLKPGDRDLQEKIQSLDLLKEDTLDIAHREQKAGNVEKAEEFYKRALGGERELEARHKLIELYFKEDREEESIPLLDKALQEAPEDYALTLQRVRALSKAGRLEEALQDCERAIGAYPEVPLAWSLKGSVEARMGRREEARSSYEKVLTLDPEDAGTAKKLKDLSKQDKREVQLEEELRSIPDLPDQAVQSIVASFNSLDEVKKAKMKDLASLEGVSEDLAKALLKQLRKGT